MHALIPACPTGAASCSLVQALIACPVPVAMLAGHGEALTYIGTSRGWDELHASRAAPGTWPGRRHIDVFPEAYPGHERSNAAWVASREAAERGENYDVPAEVWADGDRVHASRWGSFPVPGSGIGFYVVPIDVVALQAMAALRGGS